MPTGLIEANGSAIVVLKTPLESYSDAEYTDPAWLKIACQEKRKNVREERGLDHNNADILKYLRTASGLSKLAYDGSKDPNTYRMSDVDETAWCACFVKWCLKEAGRTTNPVRRQRLGGTTGRS